MTHDAIIIGAGAVGLATAWRLAGFGLRALVLERNAISSGTSWHAAGIVGPLRGSPGMTRIAMEALRAFPALEAETGLSTGYRRTGGWWLARDPARLDEFRRTAALGRLAGLGCEVVETGFNIPGVDPSGLVGGLRVEADASVNPVDLCAAYARAARLKGAEIRENARVAEIIVEGGAAKGVRLASGEEIAAGKVAICCGAWSKALTDPLGVALPLAAVEHMYVVTEPMDLPQPYPVLRDLDGGIYVKGDAGKLVIGQFEYDAKVWEPEGAEGDRAFLEMPEDWDQFAPAMEAALRLIPSLRETGIRRFMNGPESFTTDGRPMVGEAPGLSGLFVAAGMNSVGVMSSAGVGLALAEWMAKGEAPRDLWEIDIARADPRASDRAYMAERMGEVVGDVMAVHWPFKQPKRGRGLRRSALHDRWAAAGAVFGQTAGWERGLWYAADAAERDLPHSTGRQAWAGIAAREAQKMAAGAAILDLSPFTKLDVTGPGACAALQTLCAADIDVAIGRVVYAPMLNARGGIEADATVTRLAEDAFRIVTSAATRWRDRRWIARGLAGCSVTLADMTEAFSVIGLMGPEARDILLNLSDKTKLQKSGFLDSDGLRAMPFGRSHMISVARVECRATRMSFAGELGYELTVPNEYAPTLFDALRPHAAPLGHYALEGCRVEKGFLHWGHDIGPDVTPLEAGLGFAIGWSKPDFTGKAALIAQRGAGIRRRLALFRVEGDPLILHDEPIREGGAHVGLTTSGALGPRTGLTLAFGLIDIEPGETKAETAGRRFTIEVAGRECPAHALTEPPYDPKGERMRG